MSFYLSEKLFAKDLIKAAKSKLELKNNRNNAILNCIDIHNKIAKSFISKNKFTKSVIGTYYKRIGFSLNKYSGLSYFLTALELSKQGDQKRYNSLKRSQYITLLSEKSCPIYYRQRYERIIQK